ncbi:MAG TPA: SurA N-terminal domain-containing protein [Devosiaceae bacterium]|jgi:peptidyl-prolyl cis-trans isomerase SurA|nr:SurA N-terminal domain-containing protein [Devosiaceae bacterium]
MTMSRTLTALAVVLALSFGGTLPTLAAGVRVTVNDTPITDVQISQRAKLMALEHHPGNLTTAATDELINEALELQNAKLYGVNITDAQVEDAYTSISRNMKVSPDKLTLILNSAGVGPETLKARMRATLAWNQITQNVIMPRVQFSEASLAKEAQSKLTAANSYDYILKQVTFIGKGSRMADANRYRAEFKGCNSAVALSEKFTDAAVTDVGRRHATQLPLPVASELGALPVNGITRPHADPAGTIMLAVCSKEVAKDTTFITNQLRQTAGNDQLKGEQDKYLADLKAKAKIVRS